MEAIKFIAALIGIVLGWALTGVLMFWAANALERRRK